MMTGNRSRWPYHCVASFCGCTRMNPMVGLAPRCLAEKTSLKNAAELVLDHNPHWLPP